MSSEPPTLVPHPPTLQPQPHRAAVAVAAQHRATAGALGALFMALHLPLSDGFRSDCPVCSRGGALAGERALPASGLAAATQRSPIPILTGLPGPASVVRVRPKAVAGEIEEAPAASPVVPETPAMLSALDPAATAFAPIASAPQRPSAVAGEIFSAPPAPPPPWVDIRDPFTTTPGLIRPTVLAAAPSPSPSPVPSGPPASPPSGAPPSGAPPSGSPPPAPPPPAGSPPAGSPPAGSPPAEPPPPGPPPAEPPPPPAPPPPPPAPPPILPPPPPGVPLPGTAWLLFGGLGSLWVGMRKMRQARR